MKTAFALLLLAPITAQAKPVSYVGGTMVMQENDETGQTLTLDYTFDPHYSAGLYVKHEIEGDEYTTVGPQLNSLIYRWNLPGAQGNIFNTTGAGVSQYHGRDELTAWAGFLGDFETRRYFTSYELRAMHVDKVEDYYWQRARVGIAPYITGYDGLHTWLMVQVDDHPAKNDTWVVTPLVRFFYHTTLVEAGYSSNNHLMFNWILQF